MSPENAEAADAGSGRIIASHGRRVAIETPGGELLRCKVAGRRLEVVCGDEVLWQSEAGEYAVVERQPRRSALLRTDSAGRTETIVANVTQLVVVLAPRPSPDFFIVDRYLAAAELCGMGGALALNKVDIGGADLDTCRSELSAFEQAGYVVLECSMVTGAGLSELREQLSGQVTVLVGQSGAGKSSLANALLPGLEAAVSSLSRSTAEGRHTTTVSTLHHLPSGGDLIDSPGVRDFAPAMELLHQPALGFREFPPLADRCRFSDCSHLKEPGCAVKAAIEGGQLSPRRYESYRRLMRLKADLAPKPGRGAARTASRR